MPRYVVAAGPLVHDLQRAEEGAEVDMPREVAEPLVALGVLVPKAKAGAPAAAPQE